MKSNFFCLSEKDVDFRVFHFQRRVLVAKEGLGLGAWLPFLLSLTLRSFFFNLYLIFLFLSFSVLDVFEGKEAIGGVVLGVELFEVAFFGVTVQRLVSLFLFLFLIFLEVLDVFFVMISVNRYDFWSY